MSTSLHVLSGAIDQRERATIKTGGRRAEDQIEIRLLADGRRSGDNGVWAEILSGDLALLDRVIRAQVHVEISFQSGHARVYFETTLLTRRRPFLRGERVLFAWPAQLRVAERRRSERERIPEEVEVTARLQLGEGGRAEMPLYVWDLSATGAAFLCPPGKRPPRFEPGEVLHVCLTFWGADHKLTVRHCRTQILPGGRVRLGVEFDAPEGAEPVTPPALLRLLEDLKTRRIRNTLGSALAGRGAA